MRAQYHYLHTLPSNVAWQVALACNVECYGERSSDLLAKVTGMIQARKFMTRTKGISHSSHASLVIYPGMENKCERLIFSPTARKHAPLQTFG